jgi:hypothetical protein
MNPEERPFWPLHARAPEGTVFTCGLCGHRFTHSGLVCGTCPMKTGCALVRCPHCHFQFPRSSGIVEFVRRAFRRAWRR